MRFRALLRKALCVATACALLAQEAGAATVTVSNALDDGSAGSLRVVLGAAAAGDTVSWAGNGSAGTINILATDLPSVPATTTLDVTNAKDGGGAAASVTIAGAFNLPLGGGVTFLNGGANDWTISSFISGTGSLTKAGAGTLVLSTRDNTYSGGTLLNAGTLSVDSDARLGAAAGLLTFDGGTLKTTGAGVASGRSLTLNSGGGAIEVDGGGNTAAFSGSIYGPGSLTKKGGGTLALTGSSYYSGGTTLDAGTLSVNSDAALGYGGGALTFNGGTLKTAAGIGSLRGVTLNAGGGVVDTAGFDSVLWGDIGGAGKLTKNGAGILYLRGYNTYSGGTLLKAGTVNIIADDCLGAASGPVTFDGGTLQTVVGMTLSRNMALEDEGGTINVYDKVLTLTGVISGANGGAFTKAGEGTLVLVGAGTYDGATNANAGILELGADNVLPAGTDLTVAAGGTLEMGGHTQSVASYTGPGTLRLRLQPNVNNLAVTGGVGKNATLTGGTLAVSIAPQAFTAGQTFTPIKVTGAGAVVGTFARITSPAALSFTPTYTDTDVTLTVGLVPFADIAGTGNQAEVGKGLEPLRANPTGDAATVLGELYTLDATQLRSALDQIGPVSLASMAGAGAGASGLQSGVLSQRMAVLAGGARGGGSASHKGDGRSPFPGPLVASAGAADVEINEPLDAGSEASWGLFTSGVYADGRLREAYGGSGLQPGYAFNSAGVIVGADRVVSDHLAAGLSAGYVRGHASIYAPGSGTVDSHSARFGGYATAFSERAHANLYLGGALDLFSTNRDIVVGSLKRTATADPVAGEFNADAGVGYDFRPTPWGTFSPFAGLSYDRLMIGSFTEDGAGDLDLAVGRQTAETLRSRVGLRLSEKFDGGSYVFTPYASAGWRHELLSQSRPIEARLARGAGNAFSVKTGDYARDGMLLGAGFSLDWSDRLSAKFDYSGDFRSHFMENVFNAGLRLKF
ncbi:MAG: autotransporter domain-containing protein [Elusimicrobia bacterium]|nr:autotransporter domain-containing protein [Elusimicrobiota bacterium]